MSVARHPRPKELEGVPVEDIMKSYVGRFKEKKADWAAFEDAKIEGYKRAQHRFIGAGGSGKHGDPSVIPAGNFTLSIMYVEPGQGNAAHTHEVEECFFVLQGYLDVFVEDESGKRLTTRLGPWESHFLPGRCHPRLPERLAGAGLLPGHARPRQAGDHGLRRRRPVQAQGCAPEGGVSVQGARRGAATSWRSPTASSLTRACSTVSGTSACAIPIIRIAICCRAHAARSWSSRPICWSSHSTPSRWVRRRPSFTASA